MLAMTWECRWREFKLASRSNQIVQLSILHRIPHFPGKLHQFRWKNQMLAGTSGKKSTAQKEKDLMEPLTKIPFKMTSWVLTPPLCWNPDWLWICWLSCERFPDSEGGLILCLYSAYTLDILCFYSAFTLPACMCTYSSSTVVLLLLAPSYSAKGGTQQPYTCWDIFLIIKPAIPKSLHLAFWNPILQGAQTIWHITFP